MYLLASSLVAALFGERRVLARGGGRVRTKAYLNILRTILIQSITCEGPNVREF